MKMKFFCLMAVLAVLMGVGVSCGNIGGDEGDNPYKKLNLTTKSEEYVKQGTGFAFEFIDRIQASEPGDFFISPLSMQFLLGMLLNGAQGETADEICQVLGYGAGEVAAVNDYCLSMLTRCSTAIKIRSGSPTRQRLPTLTFRKMPLP